MIQLLSRTKNKIKVIKCKTINYFKNIKNAKELPKSKWKRLSIGMMASLSIFGIGMFGSSLPAVAKEMA